MTLTLTLTATIYSGQHGQVRGGTKCFQIERGVKQGDILSPILFNAGLELAMRRWKARLTSQGIDVGSGILLQDVRYADDLMIYADSLQDLIFMLELFFEELRRIGLEINSKKCRILTTAFDVNVPHYIDVAGEFLPVVSDCKKHRYLGRMLAGNPFQRSAVEFSHRCQCA